MSFYNLASKSNSSTTFLIGAFLYPLANLKSKELEECKLYSIFLVLIVWHEQKNTRHN